MFVVFVVCLLCLLFVLFFVICKNYYIINIYNIIIFTNEEGCYFLWQKTKDDEGRSHISGNWLYGRKKTKNYEGGLATYRPVDPAS